MTPERFLNWIEEIICFNHSKTAGENMISVALHWLQVKVHALQHSVWFQQ